MRYNHVDVLILLINSSEFQDFDINPKISVQKATFCLKLKLRSNENKIPHCMRQGEFFIGMGHNWIQIFVLLGWFHQEKNKKIPNLKQKHFYTKVCKLTLALSMPGCWINLWFLLNVQYVTVLKLLDIQSSILWNFKRYFYLLQRYFYLLQRYFYLLHMPTTRPTLPTREILYNCSHM